MTSCVKKEDLRIKKTYKALVDAMIKILNYKNFNQITVNDLCEVALISRATFYVHFNDKYNLLKYYLTNLSTDFIDDVPNYDIFANRVNQFISSNQKLLRNILIDANNETWELANNCIAQIVAVTITRHGDISPKNQATLTNFCTGGVFNILLLLVKSNFPADEKLMTPFLYESMMQIISREKNN